MDDDPPSLAAWLTLARARRLSTAAARRLAAERGPLAAAAGLAATEPGLARAVEDERRRARELGWTILHPDHPRYPDLLLALEDPPCVLWARGRLDALGAPAAAIVGSRRASAYGLRLAGEIAAGLAHAGVVVVSGMALGIDGAAHRAALDAGGVTIAVWGTGAGTVYPREHGPLARRILAEGAVVTEFGPAVGAQPHHFPVRNRIVAALADVVVVVEASPKSGSLHTAATAADLGRPVFAVPGRVGDPGSEGTLALLADGAGMARSAADVIAGLDGARRPDGSSWVVERPAGAGDPAAGLDPAAARLLALLPRDEERPLDDLVEALGGAVDAVLAGLFGLQLSGHVEALPGGRYRRAVRR